MERRKNQETEQGSQIVGGTGCPLRLHNCVDTAAAQVVPWQERHFIRNGEGSQRKVNTLVLLRRRAHFTSCGSDCFHTGTEKETRISPGMACLLGIFGIVLLPHETGG